jgi:hypothetical protein
MEKSLNTVNHLIFERLDLRNVFREAKKEMSVTDSRIKSLEKDAIVLEKVITS